MKGIRRLFLPALLLPAFGNRFIVNKPTTLLDASSNSNAEKKTTTTIKSKLPNPNDLKIEPVSKTEFVHMIKDIDNVSYRLVSVSIRCMLNFCFLDKARAYSYGVYLNPAAIEAVAQDGNLNKIVSVKDLPAVVPKRPAFIPSTHFQGGKENYYFGNGAEGVGYYIDGNPAKPNLVPGVCLRLLFLKDVSGEHVARGFEKTLMKRLDGVTDAATLDDYRSLIALFKKEASFSRGTKFDFFRNQDGSLTIAKDGSFLIELRSSLVGAAVLDAFLGGNGHLSGECKKELVENAKLIFEHRPIVEFVN